MQSKVQPKKKTAQSASKSKTGTRRKAGSTKSAPKKKAAKTSATGSKKPAKKKASALDAAATVLAGSKEPKTTKEMIEAMAEKKLWTSPGGKTPDRTLYSAILREINAKGKDARFKKAERGKFARVN